MALRAVRLPCGSHLDVLLPSHAFELSIGWDGIDCEKIASRHFATSATNKRGLEAVKMLNRGLAELRETGEWYDIVASTLAEASSITQ